MPKLKVYRTPIGFHDAYVAAPSQKAALKAWGADADLFARGAADVVTDPALSEAPLAHPGNVIRLPRGTEAQHIKALGRKPATARLKRETAEPEADAPPPSSRAETGASIAAPVRKAKQPKPSRPRPSRTALDQAETAIRDAEARHEAEQNALAERKRALEQDQRALRERQATEKEGLETALKSASARFRAKLEAWAADAD